MLSQPEKAETFSALMNILEEELEWINARQYSSEPEYVALFEAIHNIPHSLQDGSEIARNLTTMLQNLTTRISRKFKLVIDLCIGQVSQERDRMVELEQLLQTHKDKADTLEEANHSLHTKLQHWEHQYEVLKAQTAEMQLRYEMELGRAKREKKMYKRTFLQVQEETEEERKLLQNLQLEKYEISQQMKQEQRTKQALLTQIEELKMTVAASAEKIATSASKLTYEEKRIAKLEEELESKNKTIEELREQQLRKDSYEEVRSEKYSNNIALEIDEGQVDLATKKLTYVQKFKLGDEISNEEDYDYRRSVFFADQVNEKKSFASHQSFHDFKHTNEEKDGGKINDSFVESEHLQKEKDIIKRSMSEHQKLHRSIIEEEIQQSRVKISPNQMSLPNLYYAHYILTVQAVKLKLDRWELFGVDVNECYNEMLDERIAFHEWDIWIKSKLLSLAGTAN